MSALVEKMIVAFDDEMERQRATHGWPAHPKPPFNEWPQEERDATIAVMGAALKTLREPPECILEAGWEYFSTKYSFDALGIWQAMIDAALQEHSTTPPRQSP